MIHPNFYGDEYIGLVKLDTIHVNLLIIKINIKFILKGYQLHSVIRSLNLIFVGKQIDFEIIKN